MRDLGRILFIINLKENRIKLPPDWQKLIRWTQKVLQHYKSTKRPSYYSSETGNGTTLDIKTNGQLSNGETQFLAKQNGHSDEVKIIIENPSGELVDNEDDDELFGTYMMQCEDGTAIMTTEL